MFAWLGGCWQEHAQKAAWLYSVVSTCICPHCVSRLHTVKHVAAFSSSSCAILLSDSLLAVIRVLASNLHTTTPSLQQGIGMQVLAYDIAENPAVVAMGIPYMSIEEILPQADVVTLHVPLLPSTYELMNRPR